MQKKYQIFISSTYNDLKEERAATAKAILHIHHFPIGMEHFNADSFEQWAVIKDAIDATDYYVLILGKRYGSVISSGEDEGISYTEKEYNYAVSRGIPVLAFIKSDNAFFNDESFEEDEEKAKKQEAFIFKVKNSHTVEWFENYYELASLVVASLHIAMEKYNRPGWVREDLRFDGDDCFDEDDWFEPVRDYEFCSPRIPADGKHKEIGSYGDQIGEGDYLDGELIEGIEYNVLIQVTKGRLIYKPDCPEDPYDSSEDFEYERLEFYGWRDSSKAFALSETYILEDGLEQFYVVDFEVTKDKEHMINIRTLEEFLEEKAPKRLKELKKLIE